MIPIQQVISGQAIGSAISVLDSDTLAQVGIVGLTVGTQVYNKTVGAYFILSVSSADLVTDQVVAVAGVDGWRWIIQSKAVPATVTTAAPVSGTGTVGSPITIAAGAIPTSALAVLPNQVFPTVVIDMVANPANPYLVVPASVGKSFAITGYYWNIVTNSGLSVAAVFNVGTNASTYNNILSSQSVGGASTAGNMLFKTAANPTLPVQSVSAGGIFVNVATPAVGTALTMQVILTGYYY